MKAIERISQAIYNRSPVPFVVGSWREAGDERAVAIVGRRKSPFEGLKRAHEVVREHVDLHRRNLHTAKHTGPAGHRKRTKKEFFVKDLNPQK